tara:strand:- start:12378 stop:13529 length:1152 start_codon:yes stop_codon:yes gene_type:complete
MLIWGAVFIPLLTAVMLLYFFRHETLWWELFIPLLVSLILIGSSKAIIEHVQVTSTEYWGSFVDVVEYYEDWNEYIHQTCTRTVSCGKDCTTTETYDCSYVQYHSAYWVIRTTTNETVNITQSQYNVLMRKFGNQMFVNLNRNYHTDDGDKYYSVWPKDSILATSVTTKHTYENRVKASDLTLFNLGKVTEEDIIQYDLKSYPKITENYKMVAVLGDNDIAQFADKKFQYLNGKLGHEKEVKIFVLIFENQPREAGLLQEWLWVGANMNEFVVCVGVDKDRNVTWCHPFSWTRNELLKIETREFVQSQKKLNLTQLASFTGENVKEGFVRRDFEEFNYLTVEPPLWAVGVTYLLTLLVNIGISFWVVSNEFTENPKYSRNRWN